MCSSDLHGLEGRVSPQDLEIFQTGAHYHLTHALAMGLSALAVRAGGAGRMANAAAGLFLAGVILFSGSLYFLGFTGSRALVLVTPIGGLSLLAGWTALACCAFRSARR